jgi:hypothetical protein
MKSLFEVFIEEASVSEITGFIFLALSAVVGLCFMLDSLIPALIVIIFFLLWAFSYSVASLIKLHIGDNDE